MPFMLMAPLLFAAGLASSFVFFVAMRGGDRVPAQLQCRRVQHRDPGARLLQLSCAHLHRRRDLLPDPVGVLRGKPASRPAAVAANRYSLCGSGGPLPAMLSVGTDLIMMRYRSRCFRSWSCSRAACCWPAWIGLPRERSREVATLKPMSRAGTKSDRVASHPRPSTSCAGGRLRSRPAVRKRARPPTVPITTDAATNPDDGVPTSTMHAGTAPRVAPAPGRNRHPAPCRWRWCAGGTGAGSAVQRRCWRLRAIAALVSGRRRRGLSTRSRLGGIARTPASARTPQNLPCPDPQ